MLRVHCVQLFYNLSDPGMEDLLYEVESVRRFAGLRLTGPLPDETTILKFRHLLERHGLGEGLFAEINAHLASQGYGVRKGTIVDASIVDAPSSTKNAKGGRDPEMHQTKKGNQWYFGMKAQIGVDAETGLAHSLEATAANVSDVATAHVGAARRRGHGVGRRGLPGRRQAGGEPRTRRWIGETAMKPGKRRRLDKSGPEEAAERLQGLGAGEGGASVPAREAAVRLREGPLPWPGEEPAADLVAARLRESADRGPLRDGVNAGPLRPFPAETVGNGTKGVETGVSGAFSGTFGNTSAATMDARFPVQSAAVRSRPKPGLIRPSLVHLEAKRRGRRITRWRQGRARRLQDVCREGVVHV